MKVMVIPIVISALEMISKWLDKERRNRDQRKNWDHPDHRTVKDQLEYLAESWRVAVIQMSVKTGMKNSKGVEY